MSNALFSTQRKRRVRASMTLQATLLMALCVGLMLWLTRHGVAAPSATPATVAWWGALSLGGMLLMYALVRSGISERWPDPALTLVQIVLGVTSSAVAYVLAGEARGIVPAMLALTLLFAGLNLQRWQLGVCVLYAVGAYAVALMLTHHERHALPSTIEQLNMGVLVVTLLGSWILGARMASLRQYLHRQRQDLQHALDENRALAAHDALTGLLNRRSLQEVLHVEQQRSLRGHSKLLVALVDLDHFKTVNDTFGHHTGDAVLQLFAQLSKRNLRATDVVGRWGGEEFLIVMVETDLPVAQEVLNRLREVLARASVPCTPDLQASCSMGLTRHAPGETVEDTIRRADKALYMAKQHGRNRVVVLHPDAVHPARPPLTPWLAQL